MSVIFIGISALVVLAVWWSIRPSRGSSFDAYQRRYPHLVKDGLVMCVKCGGKSIWMKRIVRSPFGSIYSHTCRSCGTELYESSGS